MSRPTLAALTVSLAVAIAGCGGSDDDSGGSPASTTAAQSAGAAAGKVDIASFKYVPASATAKAGAPLTFTNSDSADHTATSDTAGAFDTGPLKRGDSKPVRLTKPGRYAYHCDFHPFMHGVLVVR